MLAVPSNAIESALRSVSGVAGKPVIDATNAYGGRDERYASLAEHVKAITGGPVAKGFNVNFAVVYDEIDRQSVRPSNLVCGDREALELAEKLSRDAGYDPASAGGLENARLLEDHLALVTAVRQAAGGPYFYRIALPGQL